MDLERFPLFSFLVRHEKSNLFLHPNFVTALLNDLFGIQTRPGCACAGPNVQNLLGINYEQAKQYENILIPDSRLDKNLLHNSHDTSNYEILRPGFTRFNLAFFFSDEKVDFVLNSIKFVCENGWMFLPMYIFNMETGEFRHRNLQVFKDRKWLGNINYRNNMFNYAQKSVINEKEFNSLPLNEDDIFKAAFKSLELAKNNTYQISDQRLVFNEKSQELRWFLLPSEAYGFIHNIKSLYKENLKRPFNPRTYRKDQIKIHYYDKDNNKIVNATTANSASISLMANKKKMICIPKRPPLIKNRIINKSIDSTENSKTGYKWCNPSKSIFKPFIQVFILIFSFQISSKFTKFYLGSRRIQYDSKW
jgi:hypothetical protein